jgi:hypothetical protein
MNEVTFLGGEGQEQLVSVIGQYNSVKHIERLYDEMTFLLHWSQSDDWTPPVTPTITALYHANAIALTVETSDDTGVYRVLATYTHNDGLWQSQDLTGTGTIWTGSIPAYPETEFFIQVVDKAGNPTVDDNQGRYYRPPLTMEALTAPQSGDPGTEVVYTLQLTNTADASDSFSLAVAGSNWDVTVPSSVGPLAPGESATITASVAIDTTAGSGVSDAALIIAASQSDEVWSAGAILTTTANAVYNVVLEAPDAVKVGPPGSAVTHTVQLTNRGNIADSFDLATSGNVWATTLPAQIGPLAVGESTTIEVVTTISSAAEDGDANTFDLTARSQGDEAVSDVITLTVRVADDKTTSVYLPLILNKQ